MRTLITVLLFMFFGGISIGQNTFEITETNNVTNLSDYEEALKEANMDRYRYQNDRREIHFKTGVIVELLSISELEEMGIEATSKGAVKQAGYVEPIFVLKENGYIIESHQSSGKHYPKKPTR